MSVWAKYLDHEWELIEDCGDDDPEEFLIEYKIAFSDEWQVEIRNN
jgi:hypothetical protein